MAANQPSLLSLHTWWIADVFICHPLKQTFDFTKCTDKELCSVAFPSVDLENLYSEKCDSKQIGNQRRNVCTFTAVL